MQVGSLSRRVDSLTQRLEESDNVKARLVQKIGGLSPTHQKIAGIDQDWSRVGMDLRMSAETRQNLECVYEKMRSDVQAAVDERIQLQGLCAQQKDEMEVLVRQGEGEKVQVQLLQEEMLRIEGDLSRLKSSWAEDKGKITVLEREIQRLDFGLLRTEDGLQWNEKIAALERQRQQLGSECERNEVARDQLHEMFLQQKEEIMKLPQTRHGKSDAEPKSEDLGVSNMVRVDSSTGNVFVVSRGRGKDKLEEELRSQLQRIFMQHKAEIEMLAQMDVGLFEAKFSNLQEDICMMIMSQPIVASLESQIRRLKAENGALTTQVIEVSNFLESKLQGLEEKLLESETARKQLQKPSVRNEASRNHQGEGFIGEEVDGIPAKKGRSEEIQVGHREGSSNFPDDRPSSMGGRGSQHQDGQSAEQDDSQGVEMVGDSKIRHESAEILKAWEGGHPEVNVGIGVRTGCNRNFTEGMQRSQRHVDAPGHAKSPKKHEDGWTVVRELHQGWVESGGNPNRSSWGAGRSELECYFSSDRCLAHSRSYNASARMSTAISPSAGSSNLKVFTGARHSLSPKRSHQVHSADDCDAAGAWILPLSSMRVSPPGSGRDLSLSVPWSSNSHRVSPTESSNNFGDSNNLQNSPLGSNTIRHLPSRPCHSAAASGVEGNWIYRTGW